MNIKKTWKGINDVLHRRKKTTLQTAFKDSDIQFKKKGNKTVKEPSQVPYICNKHFCVSTIWATILDKVDGQCSPSSF